MDKWIEEFRKRLGKLELNAEKAAKSGDEMASGDLRVYKLVIGMFDRLEPREQPAPTPAPAESLHEMAKRYISESNGDTMASFIYELSHTPGAEAMIEAVRQWAAENPPKPALTGVCALCSNAGVGCGNCIHNPRHADHFHASDKS